MPAPSLRAVREKKFKDRHLVIEVEVRERLVEQVQRCRLGEQCGNRQTLPFAAGQGVDLAGFHAVQTDRFERIAGDFAHHAGFPRPSVRGADGGQSSVVSSTVEPKGSD